MEQANKRNIKCNHHKSLTKVAKIPKNVYFRETGQIEDEDTHTHTRCSTTATIGLHSGDLFLR